MAGRTAQAKLHIKTMSGHLFGDDSLVIQCLDTSGLRGPQSNRPLALLGNTLMKMVIVEEWFPSGTPTGVADNRIQALAGNTNLARVGRTLGIDAHIITNPGHRRPISDRTLATTMEAIIGDIYLDSGKDLTAVRTAMTAMQLTASSMTV